MKIKQWFILTQLLLSVSSTFAAERLIFAVDVIRHGDRTPVNTLPAAPYYWQEGPGQLTPIGMEQGFKLGKEFRNEYIFKYHLLPPNYQSGSLYVRSTDLDRTIMSAQAVLLGMYPLETGPELVSNSYALPNGFQPVPIHTVPDSTERMLYSNSYKEFTTLLKKTVFVRADWVQKTAVLKPKFKTWSDITGFKINDLNDVESAADTLFIYQKYFLPMPKQLTPSVVKEIISAGNWAFATKFKSHQISHLVGNKLLATITHYFDTCLHTDSQLKYVLFSGHDSSILPLMTELGVPLNDPPAYASHVQMELFADDSNHYSIKVFYNDKPIKLPACEKVSCTVNEFMQIQHHDARSH